MSPPQYLDNCIERKDSKFAEKDTNRKKQKQVICDCCNFEGIINECKTKAKADTQSTCISELMR